MPRWNARVRLVEQDQWAVGHESQREVELLSSPAGQLAHGRLVAVGKAKPLKQGIAATGCPVPVKAEPSTDVPNVLGCREVLDKSELLWAVGDSGNPGDLTTIGRQHSRADPQQRGIARPVLPDDGQRLARGRTSNDTFVNTWRFFQDLSTPRTDNATGPSIRPPSLVTGAAVVRLDGRCRPSRESTPIRPARAGKCSGAIGADMRDFGH